MDTRQLDKAFSPYEQKLRAQEKLRKLLGVTEVDRPTYERYITGPIERFDRRKNIFMMVQPDNPFGEEIRNRMKARTGFDNSLQRLPQSELEPEDRIGQSLVAAAWRLCAQYHPQALPVTPPGGRVEIADKAWMTRLVKKVALFFGAEMVRITRIDQRWVYQDVDVPHKYAIIVVVPHEDGFTDTAPSHLSTAAVAKTYSMLKFITTQLADFICTLGYDAAYRETLGNQNPEINMVPLAIDAGIGEFARNGRVLSPEFGINMRLKAVTTNMPLEADKPVSFGTHEFCMACENCAAYCPANAIPFGPPTDEPIDIYNNTGLRKWYVHAERCLTFWMVNKKKWTSCGGRCIAVCPWNKPLVPRHNMIRWLAINSPQWVKGMLVRGDRSLYQRTKRIKKRAADV